MSSQSSTLDGNDSSHCGETSTSAHDFETDEHRHLSEECDTRTYRRRRSLGAWAQYSRSARGNSSSDQQFTVRQEGWWDRQMLVDRSLRSMAALTTVFAIIMIALCCTYMSDSINRPNRQTTSVGSKELTSCVTTENTSVVRYISRI